MARRNDLRAVCTRPVHGLCTVNALVYGLSVWLPMQLYALAVRCLRDTNAAGAVPTRCLYDARAISL